MPNALAHDLIIGILKYIAYAPRALCVVEPVNVNAAHRKRALAGTRRRNLRLEQ